MVDSASSIKIGKGDNNMKTSLLVLYNAFLMVDYLRIAKASTCPPQWCQSIEFYPHNLRE